MKLIPKSVMQAASGLLPLVALLSAPAESEAAEFAAAAIGNLAAGGQALKDALRQVRSSPFCSEVRSGDLFGLMLSNLLGDGQATEDAAPSPSQRPAR